MPPPTQIYEPGTQEFEEALESGFLQVSLPVGGSIDRNPESPISSQDCRRDEEGFEEDDDIEDDLSSELLQFDESDCTCDLEELSQSSSPHSVLESSDPASLVAAREPSTDRIEPETSKQTSPDSVLDFSDPAQLDDAKLSMEIQYLQQEQVSHRDENDNEEDRFVRQEDSDERANTITPATSTSSPSHHSSGQKRPRSLDDPCMTVEKTLFKDIIGHGAVKVRISEILLPLALPPQVANSVLTGVRTLPASILLYGPPGCGKTKLARAIAGEAQAAFIPVAPSDILSKYVGESEASVRVIFTEAWERAIQMDSKCAVLFFDEVDALGRKRADGGNGEGEGCSRRVLAELLMQLNHITDRKNYAPPPVYDTETNAAVAQASCGPYPRIIVVAATNRPEDCDNALLRRFGIRLLVDLPHKKHRKKLLMRLLSDIDHEISTEEFKDISEATETFSCSDLESLAREATMAPVRESIRAAVLLRKQAVGQEQKREMTLDREDGQLKLDPDTVARNSLLTSFRSLRPVVYKDFQNALDFWSDGQNSNVTSLEETKVVAEYDSSSDEEG